MRLMSYTLEQNGYIERKNRTIAKVAYNMFYVERLPLAYGEKPYTLLCIFSI